MTNNSNNGNSAQHPFDDTMTERYLFGELSEAEQERFENAYFADDEFFEHFLAVKNDLLDLYARGELDAERRSRLEKTFHTTEPRRKRISESRDFIRAVTTVSARGYELTAAEVPAAPSFLETIRRLFTVPRLATAALVLIAAVGGVWLLSRSTENTEQASQEPPPANAEQANTNQIVILLPDNSNVNLTPKNDVKGPVSNLTPEPEFAANPVPESSPKIIIVPENVVPTPEPPKVAQNEPPQIDPPPVVSQPTPKPEIVAGNRTESVTLDGSSRSATRRNTAEIGSATQTVSVRLLFRGPAYPSYSVRVATIAGRTVWQARNLKTAMTEGAKSLAVSIPAGSLSGKDYIVTLEGRTPEGQTETVREYYFRVDRP